MIRAYLVILLMGLMTHSVLAENIDWVNSAVTNVGWHTALNWEDSILPGSISGHNVILNSATDAPFVVQSFEPDNAVDITMRNESLLTIEEDLNNIDDFYLGPNANNMGAYVVHSAGTVSAKQISVGYNELATSESLYTLSADGKIVTSENISVGKGTLRVEGSDGSISVGKDLDLSGGGDLYFELGLYDPAPFNVAGTMSVNESNSVLTIDGSGYRNGSGTFELIHYGASDGAFASTNIVLKGLKSNLSATVSADADSLNLNVTAAVVSASNGQLWLTMNSRAGSAAAESTDLQLNNGHHASTLQSPNLSCARSSDGDDWLYAMSWAGNDFDGDGAADTLTFDLRVRAYRDTAFIYSTNAWSSAVSALGSTESISESNGRWGVGSDSDLDAGESLRFSVENVQVSVPGFEAEVYGFTEFGLNEVSGNTHEHIRGTGIGDQLESGDADNAADYSFSALSPLMVTCAGNASAAGFQIDSIELSMKVCDPNAEPVWNVSDYSYMKDGIGFVEPYPAQPAGTVFPEFSWDKVPLWLAVRNLDAYSAEQISTIATNYQLVMLEKSNKNGLTYTEEGQLKMAADLKIANPSVKVITYWNAGMLYEDYQASENYDYDNWTELEVDSDGYVSDSMQRDTQYRYEHSVEEFRDWWVDTALVMAADENVDGVFIDVPRAHNLHFYDEAGVAQTPETLMYDALKKGMPANKMLVGNCLRSEYDNGHRQIMECFDGSYLERWKMWDRESLIDQSEGDVIVNSIQLMREALALGKMINLQSDPDGPGIDDDPEPEGYDNLELRREYAEKYVDFPLAVFLIVAETNAYFGYNMGVNAIEQDYNDDVWDASFIPALNRPLGAPLSAPTRDGYIYTRSYEHVQVWVNVESKESLFVWDSDDADGDGMNDLWEYRHFGSTTDAVVSDDPDADAHNNLLEYAFGGDPTNATDIGYTPSATTAYEDGVQVFEITHACRSADTETLSYSIESTSNLSSNDWKTVDEFEAIGSEMLDADFDVITNRIDLAEKTNAFYRVKVGN